MNKTEIEARNERGAPQHWLRPWVSDAIGRQAHNTPTTFRIFPNMNCEIFFNFGDHEVNTSVGKDFRPLAKATIFGPKSGCYQHKVGAITDWFLVQLTPIGARTLLNCPIAALANTDTDLGDVLAHSDELIDRIEGASGFGGRLLAFEKWAEGRIARSLSESRTPTLSALHGNMRAAPSKKIGKYACELNIGDRQFRNIMRDEIGLAPKELLSLFRIEHGWKSLYETGSITEASSLFADQAHFTRQFHRFTHITPSDYRRLKQSGDTIINGFDEAIAASLSIGS